MTAADRLVGTARAEIGVHEVPWGSNTGTRVRQYQAATDLGGTGWAWCGAFQVWVHQHAGVDGDGLPHQATAEIARRAIAQKAVLPYPVVGAMIVWPGRHVAMVQRVYTRTVVGTVGGNETDAVREAIRSTAGALIVAPRAVRAVAVAPPKPTRIFTFQDPEGAVLLPGTWRLKAFAANRRRTLGTLGKRAVVKKIDGHWRVRMPGEYRYTTRADRNADQKRWEAMTGRRMRRTTRMVSRLDRTQVVAQGLGKVS